MSKSLVSVAALAAALTLSLQAQSPKPPAIHTVAGGKGTRLALDVVRPRLAAQPLPAVVLIHGGGFRALAIRLAQRGYLAATVSYRPSPRYQFPAPVEDVKTAVRWLRANKLRFCLDPDRICASGGSAGGHLALFLGLTGGVAEFEGDGPHRVDAAEVLPMFLCGDLQHEPALHRTASPLNCVTPRAAPVLTIHGTEDRYVAHEQGVWLTDRLRSAGVEAELETIHGAGHGRMFGFLDKWTQSKAKT